MRPRVLFLTCHLPYPPVSGGRRREYELLRRLAGDFDIHLCAVSKTFGEDVLAAPRLQGICRTVKVFAADPASSNGEVVAAQVLRHACRPAAAHVARLVDARAVDVVHCEGFYLAQHVPDRCGVPLLLAEQNVEYELWRQRVATTCGDTSRREAFLQYRTTRDAEVRAWRRATLCASVTEDDRALMLRTDPALDVVVVPDGADHLRPARNGAAPASSREIVLVGNFAYQPNADAARHLCKDVLPLVRERVPSARVVLVGNDPPDEVRALAGADVAVTGRVPCIEPYLERAAVAVCPLRIGGGIKVKMLEALCRGKAIVTTSVGIQGLGAGVEAAVRVADDAASFAAAIADLLERPAERRDLERAAARFSARLATWDEAAAKLSACYRDLASVSVAREAAPVMN
jgi:glycosyltransferase involved in cell wall biosynthesis